MKKITFLFFIIIFFIGKAQKNSIDGLYRLNCKNPYQVFDISKDDVYLSLYKDNIYINCKISREKKIYNIYFYSEEPPINKHYKKIDTLFISKKISIGILKKHKNGLELKWYGLYNSKTKKREFVKDFVLIEDNKNHSATIFLKKCE